MAAARSLRAAGSYPGRRAAAEAFFGRIGIYSLTIRAGGRQIVSPALLAPLGGKCRAFSAASSGSGGSDCGGGGGDGSQRQQPSVGASGGILGGTEAYVHPLSQIVLEHLQASRGGWLERTGLNSGLTLNKDGTFVLRFPGTGAGGEGEGEAAGRKEEGGRIWTSYDPAEKKHWLTVHKGDLVGRYLLQDNLKPAWHLDRRSTPEKVQDAVDEMIRKLSKESKSCQTK